MDNIIPILVVAFLLFAVVRARREPPWGEAHPRRGGDPGALLALVVIGLYGLVGVLDSIGWRSGRNQPRRTVIDRLFERPKERTYSAPLATMTTGEPTPHKLQARHLLGTDGVGDDVLYLTLK